MIILIVSILAIFLRGPAIELWKMCRQRTMIVELDGMNLKIRFGRVAWLMRLIEFQQSGWQRFYIKSASHVTTTWPVA